MVLTAPLCALRHDHAALFFFVTPAGDPRLMEVVEMATRVTQNTDEAVAWACVGAAVLERILSGCTAAAAVSETIEELKGGSGEP